MTHQEDYFGQNVGTKLMPKTSRFIKWAISSDFLIFRPIINILGKKVQRKFFTVLGSGKPYNESHKRRTMGFKVKITRKITAIGFNKLNK